MSQSTKTSAPTLRPSIFDLSTGTLSLTTSTRRGADRADAEEEPEAAADALAVRVDADNEPREQKVYGYDDVKITGLSESIDRRWMKPPHAMKVCVIKDLEMFHKNKTYDIVRRIALVKYF